MHDPAGSLPDFAAIRTVQQADSLFKAGLLDRLFIMPLEFGGEEIPQNLLYVPKGAAARKAAIDQEVIAPLIQEGRISKYTANAEYQDGSVVPSAIKITVSDLETYTFTLNLWGNAVKRAEGDWDIVYAAREKLFAKYFGPITGDVQKLMNLTGTWPGGCLVQIQSIALQCWVTSSFGLTNSDMPATTCPQQYRAEEPGGQVTQHSMTIVSRPPRAVPAGLAGYGYEMLVLTRRQERWPLMFLNWAVQMEILRDVDFLDRVHQYGGVTVQDIAIGDGVMADFLVAPIQDPTPSKVDLPNGSMAFLVATRITREQMEFGRKQGGRALLQQIMQSPWGQISE
jgi:hypothetical protein